MVETGECSAVERPELACADWFIEVCWPDTLETHSLHRRVGDGLALLDR